MFHGYFENLGEPICGELRKLGIRASVRRSTFCSHIEDTGFNTIMNVLKTSTLRRLLLPGDHRHAKQFVLDERTQQIAPKISPLTTAETSAVVRQAIQVYSDMEDRSTKSKPIPHFKS